MAQPQLRIQVLGGFRVVVGDHPVPEKAWGQKRAAAVVKLLALDPSHRLHREQVMETLWPDLDLEAQANNLRFALHHARRHLEAAGAPKDAFLTRDGEMLVLGPGEAVWVDVDAFEEAVARAWRTDEASACRAALDVYAGDLLPEDLYEEWLDSRRTVLRASYLALLKRLAGLHERHGEHAQAIEALRRLVTAEPTHEDGHVALMRLYALTGQQRSALDQYDQLAAILARELDAEPEPSTLELMMAIREGEFPDSVQPLTAISGNPSVTIGSPSGRLGPPAASSTPFVGREQELNVLRATFERVLAGRGQVVLLVGEPGIGKTRTSDVFATEAMAHGVRVLWGSCYEWEGAPAYWPWIQIMRACLSERHSGLVRRWLGSGAPHVATLIPEILEHLPEIESLPVMQSEQARFQLFDSVSTFFCNVACDQPLMFILDDLHWADTPSLLFLQFLAHQVRGSRILILGTYRDIEVDRQHPLNDTVAELMRLTETQRIDLFGLPRGDVQRFIEISSGAEPSARLVDAVYDETEGNPFFVVEVTRLMAAEGRLQQPDFGPPRPIRVPASVRQVISSRLNRLPPDCSRVLSVAAVIGREFSLSLLARVSERTTTELLEILETTVESQLIQAMPVVGTYRFSHALVQDTLYEALSTMQRMRLHRQVGEVLERIHPGDLAPHYAKLAHHFVQAGVAMEADKAISYATMAGDQAMEQLAFESAADHYERAVQLLDLQEAPDPEQHYDLLMALGRAQDAIVTFGDSRASQQTFRRAAQLAREAGLVEQFARAVLGYAGPNVSQTFGCAEQIELLEAAIEALGPEDNPLLARLLARLSLDMRNYLDDVERGFQLSDAAIRMAERLADPLTLSWVLQHCFLARWLPDNLNDRLAYTERFVDAARRAGDPWHRTSSFTYRMNTLLELGDIDAAWAAASELIVAAEAAHSRYASRVALQVRTLRALMEGRLADAERFSEKQRELAYGDLAPVISSLALLRREQNHLPELRQFLESSLSNPNPTAMRTPFARRVLLALAYCDAGMRQEAEREFERLAQHDFHDFPREQGWSQCVAVACQVCLELEDQMRARILYDLLRPYEDRFLTYGGSAVCYGSAHYYLARLATIMECWEIAERHFNAAVVVHERTRTRLWLTHTQYAYADMLVRRGNADDRPKAHDLVEQALVSAEQMGMTRLAGIARTLRDRLRDTRTASRGAGGRQANHSLSSRELEVLRLIVAGRTDKEIAEALRISPRTVTTHVTHVLDKLGVHTRVEATAHAVREGIV